jgi:hypothetical protein
VLGKGVERGVQALLSPAVALKLLGQVLANGVSIRPLLNHDARDRWGLALYPMVSLMNHDCSANCDMR